MRLKIDGKVVFAATGGKPFDPTLPLVIFVHGAGLDHTVWAMQTRWFAWHGYSVMALDLPGHGKSEGPGFGSVEEMGAWLNRVIEATGGKTISLAGHSMGSFVVLAATADAGERIKRLALLGIGAEMPVHPDLLSAAKEDNPAAWDMIVSWGFGKPAHFGLNRAPGLWMQGGGRSLLARSADGVLGKDMNACDAYKGAVSAAAKIVCPTLVVSGNRDQMTPLRAAMPVAEAIDDVTTVVVKNCGHMMMLEKPDETLDALIAAF
ncbi:MAG: alpha/beta hydrolase [Pseudomonadota bacterium]|nr:alpha/beta hydrolase [Pseudomonadota bacterium]